jgi:hypothetical protein
LSNEASDIGVVERQQGELIPDSSLIGSLSQGKVLNNQLPYFYCIVMILVVNDIGVNRWIQFRGEDCSSMEFVFGRKFVFILLQEGVLEFLKFKKVQYSIVPHGVVVLSE